VDPVSQAQLGEDVAHVRLDRGVADDELAGDLGVGAPGGQQAQHLDLARAEVIELGRVDRLGFRARDEGLDDAPRDGGREQGVAARQDVDRGRPLLGRRVLEQEAAGPRGTLTSQSGSDTLTLL
jgi:hypothetical protein